MKLLRSMLLAAPLLAAAPTPLVTGALRDQYGEPLAGAHVSAGSAQGESDADGTFALRTAAGSVHISCAYCRAADATVAPDGTVAAIVFRYDAIALPSPDEADLQAVPAGDTADALGLIPFVAIDRSATAIPGTQAAYFGLFGAGGLLVNDGFADYDIAGGGSQFTTLGLFTTQRLDAADPSQAFRYGDMAGGGTFFTGSEPPGSVSATGLAGSERIGNLALRNASAAFATSLSSGGNERRESISLTTQQRIAAATVSTALLAASANRGDGETAFSESTAGARVRLDLPGALAPFLEIEGGRSTYALGGAYAPIAAAWSDFSARAGVRSQGPVAAFADAALRSSTGSYDAQAAGVPRVAGSIEQLSFEAGAESNAGALNWRAGIGAFDAGYDGNRSGLPASASNAWIVTPALAFSYAAAPRWRLDVTDSGSFRLPALTQQYVSGNASAQVRYVFYATRSVALAYTDLRRLRVTTLLSETGRSRFSEGSLRALGAAVAWQIAPDVSLRAWTLRSVASQAPAPGGTFAAAWVTYANPHGLRFDAIWRRDLLEGAPERHLDASASGLLAGDVRWFVSSDRPGHARRFEAGLRLSSP